MEPCERWSNKKVAEFTGKDCAPLVPALNVAIASAGEKILWVIAVETNPNLSRVVVRVFALFLGMQVVEIAEELIKAVRCRQELVAVAQMVLAECAVA
jgi:hypothetical protein